MSFVIHLLLQPTLYGVIIALLLAFYLVWVLARQQYLGTYQQFNLLALSLVAMMVGALVCQILFPGYLNLPTSQAEVVAALGQPFTIASLLIAYMAAALVSWRYVRHIRYPFWRMMDSNVLGLSLVFLGWLVGALIRQPSLVLGLATAALAVIFLGLLALYQKSERTGLVSSGQVVAVFSLALVVQYLLVPWQEGSSIVEYIAAGLGVISGLVVVVLRLHLKIPHTTLPQLPAGVSQKFRETFSALASRQPSSKDGLSDKKSRN